MALKSVALAASPLDQLHDIQVTEPVVFMPLSWGWWVLFLLIVIMLVTLYKLIRKRQHQQRRVQLAQSEISTATRLLEVHTVIRRACLAVWKQEQIAHLQGQAWMDFWLSTWPTAMQQDVAADLTEIQAQLYVASPDQQLTERYQALAKRWIQVSWAARLHGREVR